MKNKLLKSVVLLLTITFSTVWADMPTDVENLKAVSKENSVELTWDSASDLDGIILGYRVYYGKTSLDETDYYSDDIYTESSNTFYTVTGLENGVTYYFSVTALDEEENESVNYSNEVSATPHSEAVESPSVISATQISPEEIEIVMSEPVAVKSRTQSFFVIEKENPANEITITNAEVDGTKVYLTAETGSFSAGTIYEITATSAVEDLDGNPVSSGMTDTAIFTGKNSYEFVIEDPVIEVNDKDILEPGEELPTEEIQEPITQPPVNNEDIHPAAPEKDITPPVDATNLLVDTSTIKLDGTVTLTWTPAIDTDKDIIDQVLYTKEGTGNWDGGYSVGKISGEEKISVKSNTNYTIRIVTIDKSGNQSNGIVTVFTTQLSKTGASSLLFFGIILVVGFYFMISTKKRI